jgi:hypothetical protein
VPKKQYFAILDTETTIKDTVADFAIVICDREGVIYNQCAVLVDQHYGTHKLFYQNHETNIWGTEGLRKREENYKTMLANGSRMVASVAAINRWIAQCVGKYNPHLTAYNLAFDKDKCRNTAIDLDQFNSSFCLWHASVGNICRSKKYRQFCLDNHLFNPPTELHNMTFKTSAESVCGFIQGEFRAEPHTALEDARDFELPILVKILKTKDWRSKVEAYDWRKFQVKDHYMPR